MQTQKYDGVDLTTSARFKHGAQLSGGLTLQRTTTNRCFVVDSPQELLYCDVMPPFKPNFKMFGIVPLPWDVGATVVYQRIPGPALQALYNATSAQIAPSLGRNLSAGANAMVSVPLLQPNTIFSDTQQLVDLRFTKAFRVGRTRLLAGVDVNNVLNAAGVSSVNTNFGSQWLTPTQVMVGRLITLTTTITF